MGTIVSPVAGSNVVKGASVPISYRSDTEDFFCGGSSGVCTIRYKVDGNDISGFVPVSQTGAAPQTQADYNIVMPSTGATVTIEVEGWSAGGQLNDTATVTLNLVDPIPVATCSGPSNLSQTSATLNGTLANIPSGGSAQWEYGTTLGGPYTTLTSISPAYADGAVTGSLTGLTPGSTIYYVLKVLNAGGTLVASSSECSLTTLSAPGNPTTVDAQLVKLCSITGVLQVCDETSGDPLLLVTVTSADGDPIPTTSTEFVAPATGAGIFSTIGYYRSYYADLQGQLLVPQPTAVKDCGGTGKVLVKVCDEITTAGVATPGVCGVNQQVVDAVDIQDAEEKNPVTGGSAVNNNDNDLEMAGTAEPGETDFQIAIRFGLNIPKDAVICSAYVQFTAEGNVSTDPFSVSIRGEANDTSSPFTTVAGSITARPKTAAIVAWPNVPTWVNNAAGAAQRTPDLKTIIQEIVNRAGWVSGNNIALYFVPTSATGYRRASSIQDGSEAPKLHVEYVVNGVATSTTTCVSFFKEVDLSTGLATGVNYRINPATDAWELYTPVGNVTEGDCLCAGFDGNVGVYFAPLCMEDSTGTTFLRIIAVDGKTGKFKVVGDYDHGLNGAYTPVGIPVPCGQKGSGGSSNIYEECADTGRSVITYGSNLLTNGDLTQSTGTGATSNPTAGWTTQYTPVAGIFPGGAGTYAFFTTNAGSVTGGGNPVANNILALTGRSMAVNVGPNNAQAILSWANIYLENGASYTLEVDAAIINNPFGIGVYVDGVQVTPVVAPAVAGVWQRTATTFTWTGATGYHTVSINSNDPAAAGNDHCFDNFTLRQAFPAQSGVRTNTAFSETVRAVVDQVVEITGCNDDRRDQLLAEIAKAVVTSSAPAVTLDSHIHNVAAGASWTPANIPAGKTLVGLSYVVISGTATITDFDGTVVALIPANLGGNYNADPTGVLNPPQSIAAIAGTGRVIVHMTVK